MSLPVFADGLECTHSKREPVDRGQVEIAKDWLRAWGDRGVQIRGTFTSFDLSQIISEWARTPVSNGAVILAAKGLLYRVVPQRTDSLNAKFNLSIGRWTIHVRKRHNGHPCRARCIPIPGFHTAY